MENPMSNTGPRPLHALTSLRFFAAAVIVIGHSFDTLGLSRRWVGPFDLRQPVSFFFVLSGFILSYVYPRLNSGGERLRFLWARIARLWPAHLFTLLVVYFAVPRSATGQAALPDWLTVPLNLTLLQSWVPFAPIYFGWNAVSWSISTEFAFYLAFVALLPYWKRIWPVALAGALALVAGMITLSLACHMRVPGESEPDYWVTICGLVYVNPLARLFEFLVGMTAFRLWSVTEPRLRIGRFAGTLLELAAVILAVAAMYYTGAIASWVGQLPWPGQPGRGWLLYGGFPTIPFALLVAVMACERGWISRLLGLRPLVFLGEISYALYLFHVFPLVWYATNPAAFSDLPDWAVFLGCWSAGLLGAHLIWAFWERPLRAALLALWPAPGKAARRPASTPTGPRLLGRLVLAAEVLVMLALLAQGAWLIWRPNSPVRPVGPDAVQGLGRHCPAEALGARFGDRQALRGANVVRRRQGLSLQLAWENLREQSADLTVRITCLGPGGEIRAQFDREPGDVVTPPGGLWQQKEYLPAWALNDSVVVAVSAYDPGGTLPVDRGPRAFSGFALTLPLPGDR
jgi:peptidoglycan/LPS O-acetylase OafA/YrhL